MTRVLVAYASKMGSTRGIAEAIGDELLHRGLGAAVLNVTDLSAVDDYDAVVLGTAVYAARWRPEAAQFVKRHASELSHKPTWLFESGWIGKRPDPLVATPGGRRRAQRIGAQPPTVFGGRLDPSLATGFFDRQLARRMPGDSRDFDEIRSWAGQIADTLAATTQGHG